MTGSVWSQRASPALSPDLAVTCILLGAPYFIFPCFGNECCLLGQAALHNPACLTVPAVDTNYNCEDSMRESGSK